MYGDNDIQREINELIAEKKKQGAEIDGDALTLEIILKHKPDFVRGSGFRDFCAWEATRQLVGVELGEISDEADSSD